MKCLSRYRSKLIKEVNGYLAIIILKPEEEVIHKFRVGIKRITAFYYFINYVKPGSDIKKAIKPYRRLFKLTGKLRDVHIGKGLITDLENVDSIETQKILKKLKGLERQSYRQFKNMFAKEIPSRIRIPVIDISHLSDQTVKNRMKHFLKELLLEITSFNDRMMQRSWHNKRILLKRYHHIVNALQSCQGFAAQDNELKQIRMLEYLLGDWHDRVITTKLIQSFNGMKSDTTNTVNILRKQEKTLLNASRLYLNNFARLHGLAKSQV